MANAVNYLQLTNNDLTKEYTGYGGALDIHWEVTANIPGDIDLYKTFMLTDNVPDGLADAENIVVKVGDKTLLSLIHISEPTRLGMISYAVFCLKKKKNEKRLPGSGVRGTSRIWGDF